MKRDTTKLAAETTEERLFDNWFDPVETILRSKVRGFLETMIEEELETALARPRSDAAAKRHRALRRGRQSSVIGTAGGLES
jgi:hypothetical protein